MGAPDPRHHGPEELCKHSPLIRKRAGWGRRVGSQVTRPGFRSQPHPLRPQLQAVPIQRMGLRISCCRSLNTRHHARYFIWHSLIIQAQDSMTPAGLIYSKEQRRAGNRGQPDSKCHTSTCLRRTIPSLSIKGLRLPSGPLPSGEQQDLARDHIPRSHP